MFPPFSMLIAISIGSSCGAILRWILNHNLNPLMSQFSLGSLAANLLGGYLIGIMMVLSEQIELSPEIKLGIVTGFLGALTTFSAFSAEATTILARNEMLSLSILILSHVLGSLLMTGFGMYTARILRDFF
ncbi:MAG: fluoride efflux transporter CrcB [Waddliaceae bacterium]|nr:fluoride efflux transporter CrcB [Waddliaceae bacterium]